MNLSDKVAIVSGGASGIGAATARRFVAAGARVVLGDVQTEKGSALARELGEQAIFVQLDVTSESEWTEAIAAAEKRFGKLTTFVNSAGISLPVAFEDETLAGFRRVLSVNLEGAFLGCKHGVAALKTATGGAIINMGSTLGVKANPLFAAYSASKGGIRMLTRAVALHCAEQGYDIRVNAVLPGAIQTEMFEGVVEHSVAKGAQREAVLAAFAARHPMKRVGRPQEIAAAIAFLASDESSYITGAELPVDGGFLA